jgi:hypothetical protein
MGQLSFVFSTKKPRWSAEVQSSSQTPFSRERVGAKTLTRTSAGYLSIANEASAPAVLGTGPKVNKLSKQKKLLGNTP